MSEEAALEREEVERLREVFSDVSIAPLGRNYFRRYREVRTSLEELCESVEGDVSVDELTSHLDGEDLDFMESIVSNLETVAEEGMRRQGEVEPYVSAEADAVRLEPLLDLIRPYLSGR